MDDLVVAGTKELYPVFLSQSLARGYADSKILTDHSRRPITMRTHGAAVAREIPVIRNDLKVIRSNRVGFIFFLFVARWKNIFRLGRTEVCVCCDQRPVD
jgi:hypothetical protein